MTEIAASCSSTGEAHAPRPSLRIGVVIESTLVPAWVAKIISSLMRAEFIDLVVVAIDSERSASARWRRWSLIAPYRDLAFKTYQRLDAAVFRSRMDALAVVDVTPNITTVPSVTRSIRAIADADLDVVINLRPSLLPEDVVAAPRFGSWDYQHGAAGVYPPYFSEMFVREAVCETRLCVYRADSEKLAICRSFPLVISRLFTVPAMRRIGSAAPP